MPDEVTTKWLKIDVQVVEPYILNIYFIGMGVFFLHLVIRGRQSAGLVTNLTKKLVTDEVAENWCADSTHKYKPIYFLPFFIFVVCLVGISRRSARLV